MKVFFTIIMILVHFFYWWFQRKTHEQFCKLNLKSPLFFSTILQVETSRSTLRSILAPPREQYNDASGKQLHIYTRSFVSVCVCGAWNFCSLHSRRGFPCNQWKRARTPFFPSSGALARITWLQHAREREKERESGGSPQRARSLSALFT